MNKATILAAASAAALLTTMPAFAQANQQGSGFVTLDLNWTQTGAPAESQLDGDTMRQILERDEARVRMIQERMKAAQGKADTQKADEKKADTKTTTITVPLTNSGNSLSGDQLRQILERDRARAKAMGERIRAAQVEAEAEKYLKEHDVEFTPGKTPAGWTDNFTAAVGKAKAEKKPILALFTGSDWCPPCQQLEKNILLQPSFKNFAKKHLVTLFLDFPRDAKLDDGVKKQNDDLAKKFSVEAYPTILVLSADGEKELWKTVGYSALFLEKLQDAVKGLDKDFPETAKAVKDEMEAEAKAKAEEKAAKEKAEQEEFEKQQKELEESWEKYSSPGIIDPATANRNPWGAGRINRRGDNPLNNLSDEEREALFRELDKNGPI
ncbi:MAG: thioredoxin family protein, partial [Lentisphaeria bacterium]|nr:thioredoxin family protein [Lentisphaeria bacterium]